MNEALIKELISKTFNYYKGEDLTNIDILENKNFYYISANVKDQSKYLKRYYIITVYKWLNNQIIYSDSNFIDLDKNVHAFEVKERTHEYLKHLLRDNNI